MKKRIIGVLTTARADYGILKSLLSAVMQDPRLILELYVSGSHLQKKFSNTLTTIMSEFGDAVVKIRTGPAECDDSAVEAASMLGRGSIEFGRYFGERKPDILVIVGDRYEILGPAAAAVMHSVPIAHIHGGERTDGAIDELVRHAVTKLSTYHFVTTETYKNRVLQLGEDPRHVWNLGAPGLDWLRRIEYLPKKMLQGSLGLSFHKPTAVVTFHPETRAEPGVGCGQMLAALEETGLQAIFTPPNSDPGSSKIEREIRAAVRRCPDRFIWARNLGSQGYFSCIKYCRLVIGNSSSGIIEAPSLSAAVVNVGCRQSGRVRSPHVIDVPMKSRNIMQAIRKAISPDFRKRIANCRNPYEAGVPGQAGARIKQILAKVRIVNKSEFVDII